jgi:pyridoxamine 5'-phosphate oxidase
MQVKLKSLPASPMTLFTEWYQQFKLGFAALPNADGLSDNVMTLATSSVQGAPSCRSVLLHTYTPHQFTFFSYDHSQKGRDLAENPRAALCFYWGTRQVRVEGEVVPTSDDESDDCFYGRSRRAQLVSLVKRQSHPIDNIDVMQREMNRLDKLYPEGVKIPRPVYWRGYHVKPLRMDFWQARPANSDVLLDDRFAYSRVNKNTNEWKVELLCP